MQTLAEFEAAFRDEIGPELTQMVKGPEIRRWLNRGQSRLSVYRPLRDILTWTAGTTYVAFPADYHHLEELVPRGTTRELPRHRAFGEGIWFDEDQTIPAGSATIWYWAHWPTIDGTTRSELPPVGDDALISYCLYRFFKRLASSRSDYRTYATILGQNAVDLSELDDLAERHLADFNDGREVLADTYQQPDFFVE